MLNLTLLQEIAALAGYTISGGTGQDIINKARAQRRLNMIKNDIISRYGGKWDANYREGWLPLVGLNTTGTASWTNGSRTVTGSGTSWDSTMKGSKITGPDNAYYKIASVVSTTSLVLTQPFQGTSNTAYACNIWKDEYRLYPEALTLGGFINYLLPLSMTETWPRNMKDSFPNPGTLDYTKVYEVMGREKLTTSYSTGTASATINTNVWTGVGTSWLANVEPGMQFTVNSIVYHVLRVNSDTELETYQLAISNISAQTYAVIGKNALIVRFNAPSSQAVVGYWYWAKDYPFVNDNDEDWVAESYAEVINNGAVVKDYLDKNDVARASMSKMTYEDAIKNMKVAVDGAYTGPRTLGYNIPDAARE